MPTTLKNLKLEMPLKAGPALKRNKNKSHRSNLSYYYTPKTQPQRN